MFRTECSGDAVRMEARRVYDVARVNLLAGGREDAPLIAFALRGRHFKFGFYSNAVLFCGFDEREHKAVRFEDAARGGIESAYHIGVQLGFELEHPLARTHLDADDPILDALKIELFDGVHLVLVERSDENSAAFEWKVELFVQAVEHQCTLQFESSL